MKKKLLVFLLALTTLCTSLLGSCKFIDDLESTLNGVFSEFESAINNESSASSEKESIDDIYRIYTSRNFVKLDVVLLDSEETVRQEACVTLNKPAESLQGGYFDFVYSYAVFDIPDLEGGWKCTEFDLDSPNRILGYYRYVNSSGYSYYELIINKSKLVYRIEGESESVKRESRFSIRLSENQTEGLKLEKI